MRNKAPGPVTVDLEETQAYPSVNQAQKGQVVQSTPLTNIVQVSRPVPALSGKKASDTKELAKIKKREDANIRVLQEQCRQLSLSLFSREQKPIRSLGFTSSIGGEGKSFLSLITAIALAYDSSDPVTLIECNWEHPTLHEQFGLPALPGLAEWLRGTCHESEIRHQVNENLTLIPAGNGARDAVKLLKQVRQHGLLETFVGAKGLLIVDLPPVITAGYGLLAASLVEEVVVVARGEVIPANMLAKTCAQLQLSEASVHGVILNQGNSRIPRWIRQLL